MVASPALMAKSTTFVQDRQYAGKWQTGQVLALGSRPIIEQPQKIRCGEQLGVDFRPMTGSYFMDKLQNSNG
jgi:hypothetical protein